MTVDGRTVLEKGARVTGRVTDVQESGRVKGRASLSLVLTDVTYKGRSIPVTTRTWGATAEKTTKRDTAIVGGSAGVGALIGGIAGGKKGAAIGALGGAAAGTGAVLATTGRELHYPAETRLTFTLSQSVVL